MRMIALILALGCSGQVVSPVTAPTHEPPPRATVSLRLSETTEDPPASSLVMVVLRDQGESETHDLGDVQGICTHQIAVPPAIVQVSCWWAGESRVIRIRRQGHVLIAERNGNGGEATELGRVVLESSTEVEAIGPR